MRLTTTRGSIREAVTGFGKIITGRITLPVLEHVRLHADSKGASATATDLDQFAEYAFGGAAVQAEGDCVIPLSSLKAIAKGDAKDMVTIEPGAITVITHAGGRTMRLPVTGLDLDDWPELDAEVRTEPGEGFLEAYRRLLPFVSDDNTRYTLSGVYVDTTGSGEHPHSLVATDGRRLAAFNSMRLPVGQPVIIPSSKFLASVKFGGDVGIGLCSKKDTVWFGLASGPWRYTAKTVTGAYPNYKQVIPAVAGDSVIRFADEDAKMLEQTLPSFPGTDHITLVGKDNRVTVFGRGMDESDWTTLTLDASEYSGERRFVGVDRKYLLDALKARFREFAISDELSPVLSHTADGGTHVLMAMRVSDPEGNGEAGQVTETETEEDAVTPSESDSQPVAPVETVSVPESDSHEEVQTTDNKEEEDMASEQETTTSALDRMLEATELARTRVKEAGQALMDLSKAIRDANREQKAQEKEVAAAKAVIAKVQSLKLAA